MSRFNFNRVHYFILGFILSYTLLMFSAPTLAQTPSQEQLNQQLWKAVVYGSFKQVKQAVEAGADVKNKEYSVLFDALERDDIAIIKYLIAQGADVNSQSIVMNQTLLMWAIQLGNLERIKFLVKHGADIHGRNQEKSTPLFTAASQGNLEITKYLLAKGAKINTLNDIKESPLFGAITSSDFGVLHFLVEQGATLRIENIYGETPLTQLAANGNLKGVKYLVKKGDYGIGKDRNELTRAFQQASEYGYIDIAKYLLALGIVVEDKAKTWAQAFLNSIDEGNLEQVKFLVEHGAAINGELEESFPLILAASKGHLEIVKYLLEKGADSTVRDQYDDSTLSTAARKGHLAIVQFLVSGGYVGPLKSDDGHDALVSAAFSEQWPIVRYLLAQGADINGVDREGTTALLAAGWAGHLKLVKYLIARGADVKAKDTAGNTLLILAVARRHEPLVQYLLTKRIWFFIPLVEINTRNKEGKTALDHGFNKTMIQLLLSHGAKAGKAIPGLLGKGRLNGCWQFVAPPPHSISIMMKLRQVDIYKYTFQQTISIEGAETFQSEGTLTLSTSGRYSMTKYGATTDGNILLKEGQMVLNNDNRFQIFKPLKNCLQ